MAVERAPDGDWVILRKKPYDRGELVAGIHEDRRHREVEWGTAEGSEIW